MKPIINLIHDVAEKYLINVPDDKKEEYREIGLAIIGQIVQSAVTSAMEGAKK